MILSAPSLTPSELSVLKYVLLNLTRVYLKAESLWILILGQQVNACWKQIKVKRERVHHGVIKLGNCVLSVHEHKGHTRGGAS